MGIQLVCDDCGDNFDRIYNDLNEAKEAAMENGWDIGSEMFCPDCVDNEDDE